MLSNKGFFYPSLGVIFSPGTYSQTNYSYGNLCTKVTSCLEAIT